MVKVSDLRILGGGSGCGLELMASFHGLGFGGSTWGSGTPALPIVRLTGPKPKEIAAETFRIEYLITYKNPKS